ncbi:putative glutamate--tRNA ligase, cytoplasmic [Lachnellula subtilissima]|uniref:glutamate--tRNA ligase n=1 Tax=Lachnellula subtilissima TaxID=602034 RepID=A0A8H8RLJ9_9HELO|nr:putative glutamate--tRNA ligase, cytoplasmic [Lachnellula subtilissima]
MASFDIATKANQASVLPALVMAIHIQQEQTSLIPTVSKTFHNGDTLPSKDTIQMAYLDGKTLSGKAIIHYLAELASSTEAKGNPKRAASIQEWVDRSESFLATDMKILRNSLYELNSHLTLRSHIVGYSLTVADLAVWAAIRGNRITHSLIKQKPIQENAHRWYTYIEESNLWLSEAIAELTSFEVKERAAGSAKGASFDIDIPQVDGPMVTRFPPEPSGYLHIGHAKAALLNDYFAHKGAGTLLCRFDDTNPTKESMEFQDAILDDLKLMQIIPEKTSYSSDYFQEMYELPSKRRDLGIEETLEHFGEMKTGSEEGQRWCLRARIAYDSPNGTMRDPVIYRCNVTAHHRTGTQWKIYPTYDFCAPILDSIENVTVALRTNEYRDRNVQYEWMQDALGLRRVPIWDFSRMNFVRTVLSKRKLTRIIADGKVWGWDDPRMPTIRGILRRGMTVPVLRELILRQGPSRNILNLEWGALWALNKKYIDPISARYTAIAQENMVTCHVAGVEHSTVAEKPKYLKNLDLGTKKVLYDKTILLEQVDVQSLADNEEITLMNWGNRKVTGIDFELHLEGDFKKTKKICWLAAVSTNMIPVDLITFGYLITKDKLEKDDNLEDFLEAKTEFRTQAFADCNVAELEKGSIMQFERKGYYKLDENYKAGGRMVFFNIPSGKD